VKQIARDRGEEPADERGIDRGPLGISRHDARVGGAVDVIQEILLYGREERSRSSRGGWRRWWRRGSREHGSGC
jgi:hypothetical protein